MALPTPNVTPANWGAQLNAEITGRGVPAGGVVGQTLVKSSATDFDDAWTTQDGWGRGASSYTELNANASNASSQDVGQAHLFSVWCPGLSIQSVAFNITTAGTTGAVVRIGCWRQDDTGAFILVHDFGTADATTTGDKILTGSWVLPAGLLWFGAASQVAACSIRCGNGAVAGAVRTHGSLLGAAATNSGPRLDSLTGAFPSSSSTGWYAQGNQTVRLLLRRAA